LDGERYRIKFKDPNDLGKKIVLSIHNYDVENGELGIRNKIFQSGTEFFNPDLNAVHYFNHLYPFVGRNDVIDEINDYVNSSRKVLVISGRAGIGKSRLLLEFYSQFSKNRSFELKFLSKGGSLSNTDSFRQLSLCNNNIVVVDDAYRRGDLSPLFEVVRQNSKNMKLILTCRPYEVDTIKSQLVLNFDPVDFREPLKIKNLTFDELAKLGLSILGEDHKHYLDSLLQVAKDSPLVLVIGGRMIKENSIHPSLLECHEDFQTNVLSKFEEVITGKIDNGTNYKLYKNVLKLISALSPISLKDQIFIQEASKFLKVGALDLNEALEVLENVEILTKKGYSLKITPDVLSDHILHNACINKHGELTGFIQEIFNEFRETNLKNFIINLSELDWRVSKTGFSVDLLLKIWKGIEEQFKHGSNYKRVEILKVVHSVAHLQPERSLQIVEYAIRNPSAINEGIEGLYEYTNDDVQSYLPGILQKISYNVDYIPRCCSHLWNLGKDKEGSLGSNPNHPIRVLRDMTEYGIEKPSVVQQIVLNCVEKWLEMPDIHEHFHSPLDVLDPILEKEGDSPLFRDYGLVPRPFVVKYENAKESRHRVISILSRIAKSPRLKVVFRTLESLLTALQPPHGLYGRSISVEEYERWIPEQKEILNIIAKLTMRTEFPLIQITALSRLKWYEQRYKIDEIAKTAGSIRNSISDSFDLRLTRALLYEYSREFKDNWQDELITIEETIHNTAFEFIDMIEKGESAALYLNKKLVSLQECKVNLNPNSFLYHLGVVDPIVSGKIIDELASHAVFPLSNYIGDLLVGIRESDFERALELIRSGIKNGSQEILLGISYLYSCQGRIIEIREEDLEIIYHLLKNPDRAVKVNAVKSLSKFPENLQKIAIEFILEVDICSDPDLANAYCSVFDSNYGIDFNVLKDKEVEVILSKLELTRNFEYKADMSLSIHHFLELVLAAE
jgi:hypothetical protein